MAFARVEQRNAHLVGTVRLHTVEGRDGPISKATLTAISNTRRGSGEGYLETMVDRGGPQPGRRLVLRALQSAPGCGVMFQLIRPTLVSIEHEFMRVRGVEPLDTADGLAAVVQEWLVRLRV